MPYYYDLLSDEKIDERGYPRLVDKPLTKTEKKRTIKKLLELKSEFIAQGIPHKTGRNLLIASWNLKEFGLADGKRHPEFYYYIAEIIHAFDIVLIQELRKSTKQLNILLNILGDDWSSIINDITMGKSGNGERSLVIYNKKRVQFNGFSGELFPENRSHLLRTPHITGFTAGWKKFSLVNLHLKAGKDKEDVRANEVKDLLEVINKQIDSDALGYDNIIIAGDYNFEHDGDEESIKLLSNSGFDQIEGLKTIDASYGKEDKTYARYFIKRNDYLKIQEDEDGAEVAGAFQFRDLFEDEIDTYFKTMKKDYDRGGERNLTKEKSRRQYDVHWLPRQMSDHYPIWFEMITDSSKEYLTKKLEKL